jgi:mevalonate kinase
MEKTKKMVKYAIIAVVVLVALYQYRGRQKMERLNQLQAVQLATLQDSVAQYETEAGELYAKLQASEVEKRNVKDALEIAGHDIKKLKELDVRWRRLVSTLKLELESAGQGQASVVDTFRIVEKDTIYFQTVEPWTNSYLTLFDAKIENKQLDFSYRYNVDMDIFQTKERNKTIVTVVVNDTNAKIVTGSSIVVDNRKRFYERPVVWGAAGFLAGILVN